MAVAVSTGIARLYTADELLMMPSDAHYELIEGRLHPMAPTGDEHGYLTYDLGFEIGTFVRQNNLGRCYAAETGFLLARDPDTVLAPDFAFVARERIVGPRIRGFLPLVPDLILETRSPSDRSAGVQTKIARWLAFGARIALDLDPAAQRLTVHRPGAEPLPLGPLDIMEGYDVLPGFTLPLSRLFADRS